MQESQRPIKIEYGIPKVSQAIAEFMASCKAKENTRYALANVGIIKGQMAVTDGRRLLVVTPTDSFDPPIAKGAYHLTGEGFLLKTDDKGKFPNWRDVIPKDAKNLGDFVLDDGTGYGTAKIIKAVFDTKITLNVSWLLKALSRLKSCQCSSVAISKEDGDQSVMITADSMGAHFQYIQMPFSKPE